MMFTTAVERHVAGGGGNKFTTILDVLTKKIRLFHQTLVGVEVSNLPDNIVMAKKTNSRILLEL